jgi:hypothetical protein
MLQYEGRRRSSAERFGGFHLVGRFADRLRCAGGRFAISCQSLG